jgi:membrane-bound lytic murein transglycosylase MltF
VLLAAGIVCASASVSTAQHAKSPTPPAPVRALQTEPGKWTGDFDALLKRRMIRLLVPYSPTLFYHDRGQARGVIAEAGAELERYLNTKYPDKRPFTVVFIPTTRDRLLPGLDAGEGDVAAGSLTITRTRQKKYDFTTPTYPNIDQIFITGPGAPELQTLYDLSGQTVYVRRSKSYYTHLLALNRQFENPSPPWRVVPPIKIVPLPDELEGEDVIDMVNAGLVPIAVTEEWLADIWAPYRPNVRVRKDLVLREDTKLAWAMRQKSPKLKAVLDDFITIGHAKGLFQTLLRNATVNTRRLQTSTGKAEMKKFENTIDLFRRYAKEYQFDYLLLAAQGFQESRLDQNAKSRSGAVGIMQLLPATGRAMKVGNIRLPAPNIHAATKYMANLMDMYFTDAKFDEENRTLFAFASYNAGPANISKVRMRAMTEGVNPDVWFNQVEHVAASAIGQEPVRYVRNVFKYYVAYKLAQQTETERAEAIEQLKRRVADDDDRQ